MKEDWVGRWKGRTVVCIASGPSLTEEDCEAVRRAELPAIVTNTTFRRCLWAEVLFGHDGKWWGLYGAEVEATFAGARVTCSTAGRLLGAPESLQHKPWFVTFNNSGAAAISLAVTGNAARVVMIGFDCAKKGPKVHWHGDHPKELSNARSMGTWPKRFVAVAKLARSKGVEVINASRETALTCFPRATLEASLR